MCFQCETKCPTCCYGYRGKIFDRDGSIAYSRRLVMKMICITCIEHFDISKSMFHRWVKDKKGILLGGALGVDLGAFASVFWSDPDAVPSVPLWKVKRSWY